MRTTDRSSQVISVATFRFDRWLIGLAAAEKGLARIAFPARSTRSFHADIKRRFPGARIIEPFNAADEAHLLTEARRQIAEYLAGRLRDFTLKLDLGGMTPFQRRVLEATRKIPYGKTASYGDIARRIGSPRAARAVGGAQNRNPLPLCIPCHRVIGSDGSLVGFGGGLKLKSFLLDLERGADGGKPVEDASRARSTRP
jgi:methylated-DNA-[protein]-cysteine S-methyltransferase